MAVRGATYRQILAKYFPSTRIANEARSTASADLLWSEGAVSNYKLGGRNSLAGPLLRNVSFNYYQPSRSVRHTLSSEDFRVNYPGTVSEREVEALLGLLQLTRKSLIARVAAAGVTAQIPALEIFINERLATLWGARDNPPGRQQRQKEVGLSFNRSKRSSGVEFSKQPYVMNLVHTLVDVVGHGRAPRWLAEGLALHLAGEGPLVARYQPRKRLTTEEIERQLSDVRFASRHTKCGPHMRPPTARSNV